MKKEGFKMEDSDDKPFQCTTPGCGQVSLSTICCCHISLPGGVWKRLV